MAPLFAFLEEASHDLFDRRVPRALESRAPRAGTPLLAIRTADPASAIAQATASIGEQSALLIWDLMLGIRGINKAGAQVVTDRFGETTALGPSDVLAATRKLEKEDAILFLSNAHRFWDQPDVVQAIWNVQNRQVGRTESRLAEHPRCGASGGTTGRRDDYR